MLSPADQGLVRRDPAIRGLATLLDCEAFTAALIRAFPGLQIRAAHCRFVRYKPGLTCLALYQLDSNYGPIELQAEAFAQSRGKKVERALRVARRGGALGASRVLLADAAILIFVFPDDPVLPAIARLDADWLMRLLPTRSDLAHAPRITLRYKPRRRYVARLDGREGAVALKFYSAAGYDAAFRGASAFASCVALSHTVPVAHSAADSVIVLRWVEGAELREHLLQSDAYRPALFATGHALALVHGQSGRDLTHVSRTTQSNDLTSLAGSLSLRSPELSARLDKVARELGARLRTLPECTQPIHGDFDASQVILDGERVAIIDFDRAQLGDPATDIGNFLAYLEYDALHGRITSNRIGHVGDTLLSGYESGSAQTLDPARIRLDTAIGLLKLAPHPLRLRHADWNAVTERIVARVEALLAASAIASRSLFVNAGAVRIGGKAPPDSRARICDSN